MTFTDEGEGEREKERYSRKREEGRDERGVEEEEGEYQ